MSAAKRIWPESGDWPCQELPIFGDSLKSELRLIPSYVFLKGTKNEAIDQTG
jgi:hypothetical protein